jgi:malonyl-CoA decarboxylase
MKSSDWLKNSMGLFARKPAAAPKTAATGALNAPTSAAPAPTSTTARLAGGKPPASGGLKSKYLIELLAQLKAIVDVNISDIEGGRRAYAVAQWYASASAAQRVDCWQLMSEQFGLDAAQMQRVGSVLMGENRLAGAAEIALRNQLRCARTALIQRFAAYPDGVHFLINLRADLIKFTRANPSYQDALLALDTELELLFTTWFDVAFLELRRISWHSPASLIEKLIQYEAVHDIKSWADVKNRLDSDRRCFGFFHPRLPDVPLIFVEVVFTQDMADSMAPILDDTAPSTDVSKAKTANFYSISNTQPGLKGIGFGDSLIKQVVQALQQELPQLRQFTTLSPIPTLRPWLHNNIVQLLSLTPEKQQKKMAKLLADADKAALVAATPSASTVASSAANASAQPLAQAVLAALDSPLRPAELNEWLTQCAAQYLCHSTVGGLPMDPVARFHLGNGALVARLNAGADTSANGVRQSFGMMVNYLYDLKRLDKNRQQLANGKIASLSAVSGLVLG